MAAPQQLRWQCVGGSAPAASVAAPRWHRSVVPLRRMGASWDLGEMMAQIGSPDREESWGAPATPPDSSTRLRCELWQAPRRTVKRDLGRLWPWPDSPPGRRWRAAGAGGSAPPHMLFPASPYPDSEETLPYPDSEETLVMAGALDVACLVDVAKASTARPTPPKTRRAGSTATRFTKARAKGRVQGRQKAKPNKSAKVGAVGVPAAPGAVKGVWAKAAATTEAKGTANTKGQARGQAKAHAAKRRADAHSSDADSESSWPRGHPCGK